MVSTEDNSFWLVICDRRLYFVDLVMSFLLRHMPIVETDDSRVLWQVLYVRVTAQTAYWWKIIRKQNFVTVEKDIMVSCFCLLTLSPKHMPNGSCYFFVNLLLLRYMARSWGMYMRHLGMRRKHFSWIYQLRIIYCKLTHGLCRMREIVLV